MPKTARLQAAEEIEDDPKKAAEMHRLSAALEKLRSGRLKWDDFLQRVDLAEPALRIAATKEGDTVFHLAAFAGRKDLFDSLSKDPILPWKRNQYGLTGKEVSQFLQKGDVPFSSQPGTKVEEGEALGKLVYLPHPVFESGRALYDTLSRSQKAKLEDRIPPEKIWMGIYFDKEIQKGLHPPVSIRFIDQEVGFGVFTEQRIPSCGYVGEYTGIVQERKRKHLKDKVYCVRYTTWEMGRKHFVIDAEERGNFTRFINHSATPNLSLQSVYWRGLPRMIFIALKEIPEGTQLTFDYGTFFWKECRQTPKLF
jgi:hypothetical protein